jgi:hypothetical protein
VTAWRSLRHSPLPPALSRAAQYVRMSTEHQQYSPENQLEIIRQYATDHSMEIVQVYLDHGPSGLNDLFPKSHHEARRKAEGVLGVGGGVGELRAEVAGAEGAQGEAMIEPHIQPTSGVYRQSVGA